MPIAATFGIIKKLKKREARGRTCVLASVDGLKPVSRSQNQVIPESVCFLILKTLTPKQRRIGLANRRHLRKVNKLKPEDKAELATPIRATLI